MDKFSKTEKAAIQKAMNAKKVLSQSASLKRLTICSIPFLCFCINGMWVLLSLTKSQQIWQIRLFFRSEEGVVVVVLLLWTSCNWMRKFCLSIESKVECNQKMKLPQGLNNLHGRINHPAAEKKNSPHKPAISARTMATQAMKLEGLAAQRIGWINVSLRTHLYDHWATILPGKERRRSSLYFSLFGCESLHFQKIPPDEERTRTSLQHIQYTLSRRYVSFWMWKEPALRTHFRTEVPTKCGIVG